MADSHLEKVRNALQSTLPDDENLGVLTGYVVVAQWSDGDGDEWFTRHAGTINDEAASVWAVKGCLSHALDTVDYPVYEEEEED
jgi:hypothetical protein